MCFCLSYCLDYVGELFQFFMTLSKQQLQDACIELKNMVPDPMKDQFSFLGNRARYKFIELGMSTGVDLSIPSSRALTFPGGQSKNGYRAR